MRIAALIDPRRNNYSRGHRSCVRDSAASAHSVCARSILGWHWAARFRLSDIWRRHGSV